MPDNDLPGYDFAYSKGYSLVLHGGNRLSATYNKGKLSLTCHSSGYAELEGFYKIIRITTGKIAIPNSNFEMFEKHVLRCIPTEED
jgi:hypothetical protein